MVSSLRGLEVGRPFERALQAAVLLDALVQARVGLVVVRHGRAQQTSARESTSVLVYNGAPSNGALYIMVYFIRHFFALYIVNKTLIDTL